MKSIPAESQVYLGYVYRLQTNFTALITGWGGGEGGGEGKGGSFNSINPEFCPHLMFAVGVLATLILNPHQAPTPTTHPDSLRDQRLSPSSLLVVLLRGQGACLSMAPPPEFPALSRTTWPPRGSSISLLPD